jgi:hypothetical protein
MIFCIQKIIGKIFFIIKQVNERHHRTKIVEYGRKKKPPINNKSNIRQFSSKLTPSPHRHVQGLVISCQVKLSK